MLRIWNPHDSNPQVFPDKLQNMKTAACSCRKDIRQPQAAVSFQFPETESGGKKGETVETLLYLQRRDATRKYRHKRKCGGPDSPISST